MDKKILRGLSEAIGNPLSNILNPLFFMVFLLSAGCASTSGGPPKASADDVPEFSEDYRIGVGDNLTISVWRNPDLSVSVPVRPDGKISVPLAGDITVGNRTPEEVSASITERLSVYIRDPFVTVIVTDMGSNDYRSRVRVTGAVNNPISLPYRQGMTVLDLVLEAGGVNDFAAPGRSSLYRRSGEHIKINLSRILNKGEMSSNYPLQPGDVITIPERVF